MSTVAVQYLVQGQDGDVYGPVTLETLTVWIRENRVTAQTQLAIQGTDRWMAAVAYPEVRALLNPPPEDTLGTLADLSRAQSQAPAGHYPLSYQAPMRTTDTMAIVALVLSCIGALLCPIIFSTLGIILGFISRGNITRSRGMLGGEGLATAAIIVGIVGFALNCLVASVIMSGARFR